MASRRPGLSDLRSRLARAGAEVLSDRELLSLLVGRVATRTLERTGGIKGLARRDVDDLASLPGLGPARACALLAAVELGRRLVAPAPPAGKPISCSGDVAEWFRCRLMDCDRETIHALLLDSRHRPLRSICITEGSWTSCPVDPKVLFSACLRHGAPAVILAHNHPSGDPAPSRDDIRLTERLVRAGNLVGVRLLDHLIVGREGFHSMADAGLL
jgi:DNA repair protein RadC